MIIYVLQDGENWLVKREHEEEVVSTHDSRETAIETAKEIAIGHDAELVILKEDGTIDNLGSYGIDPFPSEDNAPEFNEEGDEGI
jgi:hypothetical protein